MDSSSVIARGDSASDSNAERTPAGFSEVSTLRLRRRLMLALSAATYLAILYATALFLGDGGTGGGFFEGWTTLDVLLILCVALSAPWTVLGFWNAAIGLALLFTRSDSRDWFAPLQRGCDPSAPLEGRTALIMTLRNEDAGRAFARLAAIRDSLDATGFGDRFDLFVLSDSDREDIMAEEEALFARLHATLAGAGAARYRRRARNDGFKAGNVRDFLERWGDDYAYFAPLDADSLMSGSALVAFAQMMERHPKLGVLQSLAVGSPNKSGFGRLFQFGMRHGMRGFTTGSAWWQGDCGPFWGHNALVRAAPFKAHCELPVLPGAPPLGGHILSHDQVEAVLMRRAGYEVRVAPIETDSWEENPPTLTDFIKREERWCNGNMQYLKLLGTPGLETVSRLQIWQAILMYVSSVAWMALAVFAALKPFETTVTDINPTLGMALFFGMFALSLAPKLTGALAVALRPGGVARYGGALRFAAGMLVEIVFSMLIAPAVAFRVTVFLIGLMFGKRIQWSGQRRDAYGLSWGDAASALWGPTLFGLVLTGLLVAGAPGVLPWAAPMLIGLVFAIPIAVLTASPACARILQKTGLAAIPEDITPHPMHEAVERAAASITGASVSPTQPATVAPLRRGPEPRPA